MIYFSLSEILLSVISASVYGAIFAFFAVFARFTVDSCRSFLPTVVMSSQKKCSLRSLLFHERVEPKSRTRGAGGEVAVFFEVTLFFIGIILVSYYSLDGAVRIYTVALAVASFFISRRLLDISVFKLLSTAFTFFFFSVGFILRPFVKTGNAVVNAVRKRSDGRRNAKKKKSLL